MLEKIIIFRNLFYKAFLISLVYYIFVALIYIFQKDWAMHITMRFYDVNKESLSLLILYFIGWMKMFTFYIFLVPALALHWTGNCLKKAQKKA